MFNYLPMRVAFYLQRIAVLCAAFAPLVLSLSASEKEKSSSNAGFVVFVDVPSSHGREMLGLKKIPEARQSTKQQKEKTNLITSYWTRSSGISPNIPEDLVFLIKSYLGIVLTYEVEHIGYDDQYDYYSSSESESSEEDPKLTWSYFKLTVSLEAKEASEGNDTLEIALTSVRSLQKQTYKPEPNPHFYLSTVTHLRKVLQEETTHFCYSALKKELLKSEAKEKEGKSTEQLLLDIYDAHTIVPVELVSKLFNLWLDQDAIYTLFREYKSSFFLIKKQARTFCPLL